MSLVRLAVLVSAVAGCQRELPPPVERQQETATGRAMAIRPRVLTLTPVPAGRLAMQGTPSQLCNLDGLGETSFGVETLVIRPEAPVLVRGWLGMDATKMAPDSAVLRFDSLDRAGEAWEVAVPVYGRREDVVQARQAPGLIDSGLDSAIELSVLPEGKYRYLAMYGDGRQMYACDVGRTIEVRK